MPSDMPTTIRRSCSIVGYVRPVCVRSQAPFAQDSRTCFKVSIHTNIHTPTLPMIELNSCTLALLNVLRCSCASMLMDTFDASHEHMCTGRRHPPDQSYYVMMYWRCMRTHKQSDAFVLAVHHDFAQGFSRAHYDCAHTCVEFATISLPPTIADTQANVHTRSLFNTQTVTCSEVVATTQCMRRRRRRRRSECLC